MISHSISHGGWPIISETTVLGTMTIYKQNHSKYQMFAYENGLLILESRLHQKCSNYLVLS